MAYDEIVATCVEIIAKRVGMTVETVNAFNTLRMHDFGREG